MSAVDKILLSVPTQQASEVANGTKRSGTVLKESQHPLQPDGGWGWVVCLTSMACNGTVFGIINTFGTLYVAMREHYAKDDPNVSFKTSWVGSVNTGVTFLMCMISSILSDRIGIRLTGIIGGVLACIGLLASAFVEELMLLYLTYGIITGIGFACSYAPSLVILGHYFKRHMGLVNGLVTFGSSVFTIALVFALPVLLDAIDLKYTLLFLAGMAVLLIPYSCTWKPIFTKDNLAVSQAAMSTMSIEMLQSQCHECCKFTRTFLNVKIWRNRGYVVWAVSCGVSLFGYFVPFVHIIKYVNDAFPGNNGSILIMCIAITSGVARVACGKLADFKWVNRVRLQQAAFAIMGIVTLCIPFSDSFGGLIAICLIIGVCDGIFICLLGPIAFDLVGERSASQALGFLLGIFSIPMTVGPPFAGLLYDHLGSYNIAFHIAGCPPIIGALIMFFIPRTKPNVPAVTTIEEFAAVSCHDIYHSKLAFEHTVEAPKVSAVTPEVIVIEDIDELEQLRASDGTIINANATLQLRLPDEESKTQDTNNSTDSEITAEPLENEPMLPVQETNASV
ncbi:monocarboxylate transporter 10 [Biomphalaria pfeifferi]|uniref:Monocarboxylate transporter 10 n=1 Tax=Biomphalaria pfeifferi TaxID=112525 RepID=A0AAD8F1L2_BIOPF|nr:monocarboxylate transporter 10 [Biomphalaria pfeifferi]